MIDLSKLTSDLGLKIQTNFCHRPLTDQLFMYIGENTFDFTYGDLVRFVQWHLGVFLGQHPHNNTQCIIFNLNNFSQERHFVKNFEDFKTYNPFDDY